MFIESPDARQPASVAHSWKRIEKWLKKHMPEVLADLRPGLAVDEITKFEQLIGQQLPEDVRESYRIHDGQEGKRILRPFRGTLRGCPGVILGLPLLPLNAGRKGPSGTDSFRVWSFWAKLAEREDDPDVEEVRDDLTSFPPDAICCRCANRGWIPLYDSDGNSFGIDLDPGPNGVRGQVINFGRDERNKYVLALSWAHFLEDIADELEAGNFVIDKDAEDGDPFRPMEPDCQGFYQVYQQWAEAKLPLAFQNAAPIEVEDEVIAPVITGKTADAGVSLVQEFIQAIHEYEMHWLKVRPIHELEIQTLVLPRVFRGLSSLTERARGSWTCQPLHDADRSPWRSASLEPTDPDESDDECAPIEIPDFVALSRTMEGDLEAQRKCLQIGVYREEAVAQKKLILARFCTARKRLKEDEFVQTYPPTYDPARCQVAEVRQAEPNQVLVVMEPEERIRYGMPEMVTIRYRLNKAEGQWRIDLREESTDAVSFERVSL